MIATLPLAQQTHQQRLKSRFAKKVAGCVILPSFLIAAAEPPLSVSRCMLPLCSSKGLILINEPRRGGLLVNLRLKGFYLANSKQHCG